MTSHRIIQGDCIEGLRTLPDARVHCCVTSPPYWGLRDYGHDGQIGLEATPEAYVARMVEVFREVRRVLRDDGTCWVNLGDSYAGNASSGGKNSNDGGPAVRVAGVPTKRGDGIKPKDLCGIPWRVAFALQADGWWLRQDIIWHKPNPMPESVRDRCTKAHEYVFLLTKSERYFYDAEAVSEPVSESSVARVSQSTWGEQAGSDRVPGKTNGPMKAVLKRSGNKERRPASDRGVPADTQGRTSGAVAGSVPWAGTTRNKRSVWTVTTRPYKGAHFAVMPAALVEPCIKAGCPEQCCPVCGKGWERVVERKRPPVECYTNSNKPDAIQPCQGGGGMGQKLNDWYKANPPVQLGWQPACKCAASDTVPGTVLDPFAGSGTTLAVAAELGRNAIGCELNPEYIELANQRIAKLKAKMPLFVA
jgi:DNA modification methylase